MGKLHCSERDIQAWIELTSFGISKSYCKHLNITQVTSTNEEEVPERT